MQSFIEEIDFLINSLTKLFVCLNKYYTQSIKSLFKVMSVRVKISNWQTSFWKNIWDLSDSKQHNGGYFKFLQKKKEEIKLYQIGTKTPFSLNLSSF